MHRLHKVLVGAGLVCVAVGAGVLLTGIYTGFSDPAFQRSLLRLLAVLGFAAVLAMCGSMLTRLEPSEKLAPATKRTRHR